MTADDDRVHVELYVRSLAPDQAQSCQDAVIEKLNRLRDESRIDEFRLLVWGKGAPASPADARTVAGLFALNRVAVFSEWAERNGLSLDDHFQRRIVDSSITGEHYRTVRFPIMTLAEYHGPDLSFVAPASGDDVQYTVTDRLEAHREPTERNEEYLEPLDNVYASPPPELTLTRPADSSLSDS